MNFRLLPKSETLMTLNGVMALILRYFAEFRSVKMVEDVVVKSSRSLSHLLMSFLSIPGHVWNRRAGRPADGV